jgi:hypothetical protein
MQIFWNTVPGDCGIKISRTGEIATTFFVQPAVTRQRTRDLSDAIGTEIETDTGIVIAYGG